MSRQNLVMMTTLGPLLTSPPPELTETEAAGILSQHYGLAGPLRRLTSERDLNLRLSAAGQCFVIKVANPAEPRLVTDFQTAALLHLEGKGLPVPQIKRTKTGATSVETPFGLLRVLTYLEGRPLHLAPTSDAQRRAIGAMAARITLGLQGFTHPGADHVLQWDIKRASALRPFLADVPQDMRGLCTATLDRFDADVAPHLAALRWQVVHNDLNPHNILVDETDPNIVAGVLDFGDMVLTPLVCDLAVAAAYQVDPADALGSLCAFATAYAQTLPLTRDEAALILDLTATRMLTTLAITSWRAARYPENAPYILRNFPSARDGLLALTALPRQEAIAALLAACNWS